MKEILSDLLDWPSDGEEWALFILAWILLLMAVAIIGWGLLELINVAFLSVHEGYGTIIQKNFIPSHHTTTLMPGAKGTVIPITTWHPDAWSIIVESEGRTGSAYLHESDYVAYNINQQVKITYSVGRLCGSLDIKTIE